MKRIILFLSLIFLAIGLTYLHFEKRLTLFDLPKGELKWSKTKPVNAKLCVPAAFSTADNYVVGSHKINGKSYGKDRANTKIVITD